MKHVIVVCALIENDKGQIFCCKRGPGRALEGYWEFPGGKVESSESFEETIVREIKEELKSDIMPVKYLGVSNYTYPDMPPYMGFKITMHGYKCKLIKGNLMLSEHVEKAWKTVEEMKNMKFAEADKYFLNYK